MNYLYTTLLDNPHELCLWAKADVDKAYKKSLTKAVVDIAHHNAKRLELNKEADALIEDIKKAHDDKDTHLVADLLDKIVDNINGKLKKVKRWE